MSVQPTRAELKVQGHFNLLSSYRLESHGGSQIFICNKGDAKDLKICFNPAAFQRYYDRSSNGFERAMLSQWKATTIDMFQSSLDIAHDSIATFRKMPAHLRKKGDPCDIRNLVVRVESTFKSIKELLPTSPKRNLPFLSLYL